MTCRLWAVVVDANDPPTLARFWAAALGWDCAEDEGIWCVSRRDGTLPRLEFVYAPNEKQAESWMHFDLSSTSEEHRHANHPADVALADVAPGGAEGEGSGSGPRRAPARASPRPGRRSLPSVPR